MHFEPESGYIRIKDLDKMDGMEVGFRIEGKGIWPLNSHLIDTLGYILLMVVLLYMRE